MVLLPKWLVLLYLGTAPIGVGTYIASGGAISAVIMQIIAGSVAGLIYYPFFKMVDTMKVAEEGEEEIKESNELETA